MASRAATASSFFLLLLLLALSLLTLASADRDRGEREKKGGEGGGGEREGGREGEKEKERERERGRGWKKLGVPRCGEGDDFFKDFMKCDASIGYCFEYRNASCVGPDNWVCVHNLNKRTDQLTGDYSNNDIKNVGYGNTRCCGGRYQSPIDIPSNDAVCDTSLPAPSYVNPGLTIIGHFENTGYYPKFFVPAEDYHVPLALQNVPFTCSTRGQPFYVFTNVHVHSGIRSAHWSAHFVDGHDYDGEIHLVHMRGDFWAPGKLDMRCASQTPNGLAVIAVFLSLTEGEHNPEVDRLLSLRNLEKIKESNADCDYDEMCDYRDGGGKSSDEDDECDDDDNNDDSSNDSSKDSSDSSNDSNNNSNDSDDSSNSDNDDNDDNYNDKGYDKEIGDIDNGDNDGVDFFGGDGEMDLDGGDKKRKRRDTDGPRMSKTYFRRGREGDEGDKRRDREKKGEGDKGGDRDGDGEDRKDRCLCRSRRRRRLYDEVSSKLKQGEQRECRLKYQYGINLLETGEQDSVPGSTQHQQCNQHGNGEPCGDHEEGVVKHFPLRPGLMLPGDRSYWQYFGSLTTPPCSEVVNWVVMKTPVRISRKQLDNLHLLESRREDHLISEYGDVRPIQPLNGRTISTNRCN